MFTKERKDAIAAKETYYITGRPCKHGHYSKRLTVDGVCIECKVIYNRNQRKRLRKILSAANNIGG